MIDVNDLDVDVPIIDAVCGGGLFTRFLPDF